MHTHTPAASRYVFCFRRVPYVTDGLHVNFARRVKLYLFRHVLRSATDLTAAECRVLDNIDDPEFAETATLLEHIQV